MCLLAPHAVREAAHACRSLPPTAVWRVEVDEAERRLWVGEKRLFLQPACPKVLGLGGHAEMSASASCLDGMIEGSFMFNCRVRR